MSELEYLNSKSISNRTKLLIFRETAADVDIGRLTNYIVAHSDFSDSRVRNIFVKFLAEKQADKKLKLISTPHRFALLFN